MNLFPGNSNIFGGLYGNSKISEIFSDVGFAQSLLRVEVALAKAQAKAGVIPEKAADEIEHGGLRLNINFERLREGTTQVGFPVIEIVRQLKAETDDSASRFVHWGTTTQDVMDTGFVLQMRAALKVIECRLDQTIKALAKQAETHQDLIGVARTHGQHAVPIVFAQRIVSWLDPLLRNRVRLMEIRPRLLVIQYGGSGGNLSPLRSKGLRVQEMLASSLGLEGTNTPWHTQRDAIAEVAGWLSLVTGCLAKMGQDVVLLSQTEVQEVRESLDSKHGGSSAMPHKNNPVASEAIIALARTNATLLSAVHQALIQEQERGTHGWQLEWLSLPQMFSHAGAALDRAVFIANNLVVDEERVRGNLEATNGQIYAEAIQYALSDHMKSDSAKNLVKEACRVAKMNKENLFDQIMKTTDFPIDWAQLRDPRTHLGSSEAFITRVLGAVRDGKPDGE